MKSFKYYFNCCPNYFPDVMSAKNDYDWTVFSHWFLSRSSWFIRFADTKSGFLRRDIRETKKDLNSRAFMAREVSSCGTSSAFSNPSVTCWHWADAFFSPHSFLTRRLPWWEKRPKEGPIFSFFPNRISPFPPLTFLYFLLPYSMVIALGMTFDRRNFTILFIFKHSWYFKNKQFTGMYLGVIKLNNPIF